MWCAHRLLVAAVLVAALAGGCAGDSFRFLNNSAIKVGLDVSKGGSIGYLSAASNDINVINTFDLGREVQLSFYSGPSGYDGCTFNGQPWPWNPIGAGDRYGHPAKITNMAELPNGGLSITSIPMQWACNNVPCECEFDKTVWLENNAVWVNATLRNHRSDTHDYGKTSQELPATYTNGFLPRLTCYTGNKPFTNDVLTNWDNASGPPWEPGHITCTENWAAFVDPQTTFGMALFRPDCPMFYTGYSGKKGTGGPHDPQTGYIAGATPGIDLQWNSTFSFTFALVLGNLPDIRAFVYQHQSMISSACMAGGANTLPPFDLPPRL